MKKFYLFLLALVAFTLTANAATRIIYLQNFETSSSVPSDWGSPSAADGLSISSDEYGKFLKFAPSGNDRSCYLYFGGETVENSGATQYSLVPMHGEITIRPQNLLLSAALSQCFLESLQTPIFVA